MRHFQGKDPPLGLIAVLFQRGEMTERFKVHAWKACVLQKGTEGSNPSLSASLMVPVPRLIV